MDPAISFAILPDLKYSKLVMEMANQTGHETLIHVPMEPISYPHNDPGPNAIYVHLSENEIRKRMEKFIADFPLCAGMNNHMGSLVTSDPKVMKIVLDVVKEHNMYFVDSKTSQSSIAYSLAQKMMIPTTENKLFLDTPNMDVVTLKSKLRQLEYLQKKYNSGTHALKGINLKVEQGEFLILLGLSGSGKSTLLRCLNRLIEPTSGEIIFFDADVTKANPNNLRKIRRQIGMVFQQFNLIKNLSVLTNVLTGKLGYKSLISSIFIRAEKEDVALAEANLKRVGLLEFKDKKVKNLSGGQQQRVAIARALMQNPKLILADEPVASLDPATADSVMRYLGELNKNDGISVICSLHFLSLARKYGKENQN